MAHEKFNISVLFGVLQFVMSLCFQERYEIVIYQKIETRNSSLSCLFCFNGDNTNDCMTLKNISNIPVQNCKLDEPYCKLHNIPLTEGLLILGDFNARVGADHPAWPKCIGHFGIGNINENGQRLLELCSVRRLTLDGKLKTFDRYCARHCDPGCRDAALYSECVSCCNHESLCNVDNSALVIALNWQIILSAFVFLVLLLQHC